MTHVNATSRRSEQGFTLVELAIVMVIIGLLIGGILKGQELIANAKISGTVSQVKGLDAAMNTFTDKYAALAGDMRNTATRLPGGVAAEDGDGNGGLNPQAGAAAALNEGTYVFSQLARADLITGINLTNNNVAAGDRLPGVKAGGVMWLGTSTGAGAATGGINTLDAGRIYAALNGTTAAVAAGGGAFTPSTAAQIDRKMDDGSATAGSTQSLCNGGGTTAAGVYNENVTTSACSMYIRVNN